MSVTSDCVLLLQANDPNVPLDLWSDRQIALSWVLFNNERDRFVRNQVQKIKAVKSVQFRFIPGYLNPVDRQQKVSILKNSLVAYNGVKGPPFLRRQLTIGLIKLDSQLIQMSQVASQLLRAPSVRYKRGNIHLSTFSVLIDSATVTVF
ncbi:unnamed protein product [Toxocara canis]|uniref:Reverse transcriptase n=1 Tax=Toxocara canis TaxID=6265 RepID=A0A183V6F5_TOXCA|nr:unnamed protein product [Toxocara canis]